MNEENKRNMLAFHENEKKGEADIKGMLLITVYIIIGTSFIGRLPIRGISGTVPKNLFSDSHLEINKMFILDMLNCVLPGFSSGISPCW
jgi:hypothetical protein